MRPLSQGTWSDGKGSGCVGAPQTSASPWSGDGQVPPLGAGRLTNKALGRLAQPERRQKSVAVDAMLAAGVIHGVEAGDRATDAAHPEMKKNRDGLWCAAHDIVDQIVKSNGHARLSFRNER